MLRRGGCCAVVGALVDSARRDLTRPPRFTSADLLPRQRREYTASLAATCSHHQITTVRALSPVEEWGRLVTPLCAKWGTAVPLSLPLTGGIRSIVRSQMDKNDLGPPRSDSQNGALDRGRSRTIVRSTSG
jgi:hypothetical protein